MNDRACRIATTMGLAPLAVGVFVVSGELVAPGGMTSLQSACASATAMAVVVTIFVWRTYVDWTRRRVILTGIALFLVASHLASFQPLWSGTCLGSQLLVSQSLGVYGIWRLVCPFVWWGAFVLVRRKQRTRIGGRRRMTKSAIRLLLGLSLVPILPALFCICYIGLKLNFGFSDELSSTTSLAICEVLAIGLWILIWRNCVQWSMTRILGTLVLAVGLLPTMITPFYRSGNDLAETIVYSSPIWMWGVWIIGTAWLWRDQSGDDLAPANTAEESPRSNPTCPKCAYSLRGLSEARCPECGWTGTLDSLFDAALGVADV